MMPHSVYLFLLVMTILALPFAWAHDRHLEDADDDTEPADHTDTRHDEWLEDQAIERRWDARQ